MHTISGPTALCWVLVVDTVIRLTAWWGLHSQGVYSCCCCCCHDEPVRRCV